MRKLVFVAMILALAITTGFGCTRATGGGEAKYLSLFSSMWPRCHSQGLYQATVESVTLTPDGDKLVVIAYLYDNGMVPDQSRAAMLVSPQGHLASQCIIDLETNLCLCGETRDWRAGQ
jgi:hypothetical protein